MNQPLLSRLAAGLVFSCALCAFAQERGTWRATGSTASAITGDIVVTDTKLTIDFTNFTIAQIRKITAAEAGAAFDVDSNAAGGGNLYRLNVPASRRFLHHNTLCGSEDTQWMVTYAAGHNLHIAFFSGPGMPVLTAEALANTTDLCGVFSYAR